MKYAPLLILCLATLANGMEEKKKNWGDIAEEEEKRLNSQPKKSWAEAVETSTPPRTAQPQNRDRWKTLGEERNKVLGKLSNKYELSKPQTKIAEKKSTPNKDTLSSTHISIEVISERLDIVSSRLDNIKKETQSIKNSIALMSKNQQEMIELVLAILKNQEEQRQQGFNYHEELYIPYPHYYPPTYTSTPWNDNTYYEPQQNNDQKNK